MILELTRKTKDLSVSSKTYQKSMKNVCSASETTTLIRFYLSFNVGFEKGFSEVKCLFPMTEKWRETIEQSGTFSALLTDCSKPFQLFTTSPYLGKLHAYDLDMSSVRLMYSYFSNRKQRVKVNGTYSSWSKILLAEPQGSILGL